MGMAKSWHDLGAGKTTGGAARSNATLKLLEQLWDCPPDSPDLLGLAMAGALALTKAGGAIIGTRDGANITVSAAVGTALPLVGRREPLARSLSGVALATGQSQLCVDARCEPRLDRVRSEKYGVRSLAVAPFVGPDNASGVLLVTSPFPGAFGGEDQELLSILARALTRRAELDGQLREYRLLLTENEIALATLRESEDRFRNAFDHSGIGMAMMSLDGRWLKVNPALCRTLGYSRQELLALDHAATTHVDDRELDLGPLRRIVTGEICRYELEKRYVHKDGSAIWGLLTVSAIQNSERQAVSLIAQIQDITARKASEESLRALAVRDDLTGVWNRREMFRLLNEETSRADRHGRPLSLIMVDVDCFKMVNDTHGHQAGDASLRQIARIIEDSVRSFDRVARYGGEEFAVILPETVGADAMVVAERIRARVAAQLFSIVHKDGTELRIALTVSSGVATMIGPTEATVEEVIRDADASLYVAKNAGRNRCVAAASALLEGRPRADDLPDTLAS
jgi:diguanylate cyclase (GGDEF)-like protein/PAS domain S-box-containing protein